MNTDTAQFRDRVRVLLVEDDAEDARLVEDCLRTNAAAGISVVHHQQLSTAPADVGRDAFDAVLLDLNLPDSSGLATLHEFRKRWPEMPIVVLTGLADEEQGIEALQAGAEDYLAKQGMEGQALIRSLRYAIERAKRREADARLQAEESCYRQLLASATSYTYTVRFHGGDPHATEHSAGCLKITGYHPDEYASDAYLWIKMVYPADRELVRRYVADIHGGQVVPPIEHRILHRDGTVRWVRNTFVRHYNGDQLIRYDGLIEDITDRKLTEQRLCRDEARLLAAQEIQSRLLPSSEPSITGFDIAGASYPADLAAGDYYGYLSMPDGSTALAVGDVSGHNIGSAMLMVLTYAHLRSLCEIETDVSEILQGVNRLLTDETNHYVTLLLGRLNPRGRTFVYASAGHPTGYVLDASGAVRVRLESTAIPMGILDPCDFPCGVPICLDPGDVMLLLTDGVTEAQNPEEEMFGSGRAIAVVGEHRHCPAREIVEHLYHAVCEFCGNHERTDDITAMVVKVGSS